MTPTPKGVSSSVWAKKGNAILMRSVRRRKFLSLGLCMDCGRGQACTQGRCYVCLLKKLARQHHSGGDGWKRLLGKFTGRCHYSGRRLCFGENVSVDHVLPSSRWPELKKDIRNLVWADTYINTMKSDRTPREFYLACADVLEHGLFSGHLWTDCGLAPYAGSRKLLMGLGSLSWWMRQGVTIN